MLTSLLMCTLQKDPNLSPPYTSQAYLVRQTKFVVTFEFEYSILTTWNLLKDLFSTKKDILLSYIFWLPFAHYPLFLQQTQASMTVPPNKNNSPWTQLQQTILYSRTTLNLHPLENHICEHWATCSSTARQKRAWRILQLSWENDSRLPFATNPF